MKCCRGGEVIMEGNGMNVVGVVKEHDSEVETGFPKNAK